MNNINRFAPAVKVPGLLSDDALQEQLKQFRDQQNDTQRAAPMPSSAVEAGPQLMRQFVDNPISRTLRATSALSPGPMKGLLSLGGAAAGMREPSEETVKNAERNRLIQERSDIAANSPSGIIGLSILGGPVAVGLSDLSPLARLGALSPEESQAAAEQRQDEASRAESAIRDKVRVREQLRGLTDEQAQQMGIPTGPLDQQTMREERDRQQSLDAERVRAAQQTTEQAEAAVADPELQVKQAQWLNILRSGYKGMTGVVTSSLKYPAAILETAIGSETAESTRTWIDTAEATLEKMMPADKARAKDFMTELAAGGGSMVGFMTLGYLAATIGLPGTATTAALGAAVGGMEQFEDAERFNADAVTKLYALMLGSAMGVSEALPINRMLFRAEQATGGLVSRMLTNTAAGSMEEFLQEFGQAAGQDIVAKWLYDEQRELDASEWFRQGAIGGITGGMAGAAVSTLHESGVLPANPVRDRAMENQLPPAEQERIVEAFIVDAQRQIDEILAPLETTEQATPVEPEAVLAARADRVPPVEYVPTTAQEVEQQGAEVVEPDTAQAVETTETAEAVEPAAAEAVEAEAAQASDFNRLIADAKTRLADRAKVADAIEAEGKPVRMTNGAGLNVLVGPNTVEGEQPFRVTYIGADGQPNGHVEAPTLRAAAVRAMEDGFAPPQQAAAQAVETTETAEAVEPAAAETPQTIAADLAARGQRPETVVAAEFADRVERAPLFDYETVEGKGGTVPAPDANGNIVLRHWTSEPRETLDPTQMGSGPLRGDERARLAGPDAAPRTYYGVRSAEDFVEPAVESREYAKLTDDEKAAIKAVPGLSARRVKQAMEERYMRERQAAGYRPEGGLGPFRHEVEVKPDDLYNTAEDPLGLRAQITSTTPGERATEYENLIRDAGFKGAYYPSGVLGQTAVLFEAATPRQVIDDRFGQPVSELATRREFDAPTAETFTKPGWAIVTATREALGPWDASENAAANDRLRRRLQRQGIEFMEVEGAYQGEPQGVSFLVFMPENAAADLGAQLQQESILTNRGLVYTDGSGRVVPAVPEQTVIGPEAQQADFFSTLPDGTSFTMGLNFDAVASAEADPAIAEQIEAVEIPPEELQPLKGLKTGKPVETVVKAARAYAASRGLPVRRQAEYVKADPDRGRRIAEAYEAMEHAPNDPAVQAAYQAMIDETLAQYQFVKATGLQIEAIEEGQPDPYPEGPKQVLEDLERGHLWFFPTDQGFGSNQSFDEWFAGSYAVDERGRPLTLFRGDLPGTPALGSGGNIFFSSSPSVARTYTNQRHNAGVDYATLGPKDGFYRANLALKNPLIIEAGGESWTSVPVPPELRDVFIYDTSQIDNIADEAKTAGYDGLIVRDVLDQMADGDQYVVFDSRQVRLIDDNPLLAPTSETLNGRTLLANDVFRIVHDFFGHGIEGSGFGARGEENAWQSHMRLYSDAALPAVTSETRGQNSWVNFGPHGEANRANQRETVYADQKTGIMPEWTWREGVADEFSRPAEAAPGSAAFDKWFGDSKVVDANGAPLVVYHGTGADFTAFGKSGQYDSGFLGEGFYFADNEHIARTYSRMRPGNERVISAYLSLENPFQWGDKGLGVRGFVQEGDRLPDAIHDEVVRRSGVEGRVRRDDVEFQEKNVSRIVREVLEEQGYDGVIATDETGRPIEFVAFRPEQVKSTENIGTFDPSNPDMFAQTSRGRGRLRAEQQRSARGTPGAADPAQDSISLGNIAQNFTRALDVTVRQGQFTLKGVLGQYSTRQDVIRLRSWNDLSTLVHEAGHAIETNAGPELKAFIKQNEALFKDAAKQLYGGYDKNMPEATKVAEGFAEFFRIYVLNRQHAEKKFTTLTNGFDDVLDRTAPELRKTLELTGQQFSAWLQLPSAQVVRNMVVSGLQTEGINAAIGEIAEDGFPTWFREVYARTVENTVNRYTQLDRLVSELLNVGQQQKGQSIDLKRADDPSTLIRLATNTGARAMVQATDGVMGYRSTDPTTKGLREALLRYHGLGPDQNLRQIDPVRQKDFAAYLITLRGMDEYRRFAEGKIDRPPLNATLADLRIAAREFEQRYGQDFKDAAQMVHDYGMGLWQKSFDAGLISKETYKDGLDRQFYVPLQREMDDRPLTTGEMSSAVGQGRSVVRRFKGSDRNVIDPMDVLMHKTFALERVIAENDVKKALATLADRVGQAGSLVERIPANKLVGMEYNVRDIARQLTKDPSVTEADAADLMTILESSIEDGNRIALFRSQQAAVAGENILFFWEKGKLAAIQLKDGDVGADIVNTMNGIGRETMPLFMDTVANISTTFRAAITSWPDFLLVNFIRDQVSAWILTDVGYVPFVSGLRGVGDEIRQTQWARQYNAAMGMMGGMNVASLHEARVNRDISALRGKGYFVRAFQGSGLRGLGQGISRVVEVTETGSRLGIFRSAYNRGKAEGLTDWEASVEASYMATDYANFGLNGSRMLAWRRTIPFLNAQLQGYYKMLRTMGGDEARRRKGLMFALKAYFKNVNGMDLSRTEKQALNTGRKAWMKMASIGFIGAALTFMLIDDPDYQEASEYLRATGWVIPTGDGELLYIPKPFELAFLSNIFERAFESASGDPEAKNRLLRGFGMTMMPPVQSPLARVVTEQAANFNFFMDREIVPDYMRALSPELQYNHYTSSFAKQLGAMMGWSPMRIDHVMSGMFASAYRDISSMYNWTDPNRPTPDATDLPITRRFVRDVRRGSASARDFWSYASTVDGSLRRAELSYRRYIDEGREDVAEAYLRELDADEHAYAVLGAHFKAEAKRLHPMYRARQISTVISAVRREMVTAIGLESTESKFSEPIKLTAREKAEADEILSEYARREVRNTLIYMQAPGWANKTPLPLDPTFDLLLRTTPDVADEVERRLRKAKVYDAEVVRDYWPDVRDRLITDGQDAFLKDVLSVAKVTTP